MVVIITMNDDTSYLIKAIARKLLSLQSIGRLNKADQETIAGIIDTDIPLIQSLLKDRKQDKDRK